MGSANRAHAAEPASESMSGRLFAPFLACVTKIIPAPDPLATFDELDCRVHLLRHEGRVVFAADLGRVAHQLCDFVQRLTFLRELAAEGMTEIQAGPSQVA